MSIQLRDDDFVFVSNTHTSYLGVNLDIVAYKVPNTNLTVANSFSVLAFAKIQLIGGTPYVTHAENVSSVSDIDVGNYYINFTNAVPAWSGSAGAYAVSAMHSEVTSGASSTYIDSTVYVNLSGFGIVTSKGTAITYVDPAVLNVIAYGT